MVIRSGVKTPRCGAVGPLVFDRDLGQVVAQAFKIMGITDVSPSFGSAAKG